MKNFSQNNEQRIILDYFGDAIRGAGPMMRGSFRWLSVGENDGELLSNSRALALMGLSGVAVEPASIPFAKLKALYADRPDIHCVNAAITLEDGPIEFYSSGTHLKKGDTDLLSTTRPEELARWKKSGEQFTKTTVRGITFDTLVKETGVSHFHFISIDVEGADYDVLKQIDLTAVGCRMLCVEVNARNEAPFHAYCAQHGMRLMTRNAENLIFVSK